jgi:hypothetical protein
MAKAGTKPKRPKAKAKKPVPTQVYHLKLNREQLEFLLILTTNATIQPSNLKRVCGEVQELVERQIGGVLPPPPTQGGPNGSRG